MAVRPSYIADTQIGLSNAEILLLRQHQPIALANAAAGMTSTNHVAYAASMASSRGRGMSRSVASSRAASAASSAGGRLMLDSNSLTVLDNYFESLMRRIQQRLVLLESQMEASILAQSKAAATTVAAADREIQRFKEIMRQIDEMETELDKVRHIGEIVRGFKPRIEALDRKLKR